MNNKQVPKLILIAILVLVIALTSSQAGIARSNQSQLSKAAIDFSGQAREREPAGAVQNVGTNAVAAAEQAETAAFLRPSACSVPTTVTVRSKSVQFDQCYERTFSHGGTNYTVHVFYTETNSATNLAQCSASENASNRCEHALANNDDGAGDNVNAVAMADEAERAVRFYHDRNLQLLSGSTTASVYIAEDPRLGGVIWPNSIYVDDDAIDNNDTLQKRILAFHEMQHLVQDKYDSLTGWIDFWGEGIARAIEDRVDVALDGDTGHLFIPEVNGILGNDGQRASDLSTINYRSVLWWTWLMDQYRLVTEVQPVTGWPAIRDFYIELNTESDQLKAVRDFISAKGSSFWKDLVDYTLALYAYRFSPSDTRLGFLDSEITATAGLSGHTVITTGPAFSTISQAMNPRSSRYWEFNPASQCDFVAFTFDGNGKTYGFSVMTVDGGVLQKKWTSYSTGWARTVRSADLDRVVGVVSAVDESGTVDIGRGCVVPTINIKDPTSSAYAMVGLANNPRHFITRLEVTGADASAVAGLVASDFQVQVRKAGGGPLINATVVNSTYVQDNYWLLVQAPSDADGAESGLFYDLIVTLGSSNDTELSALLYVERTQDVVVVLDRSGSMGGTTGKIQAARNAANLLVNELSSDDQGSFVAFDGDAYLREPLDLVTGAHRTNLFNKIAAESPGGVTSIGDGLRTAATEEDANGIAANLCSFVLLSDGHENETEFWADVQAAVTDNGCAIHTIALGPGTNELLMQQIAASVPGGTYDFATSSGGVPILLASDSLQAGELAASGFLGWENNVSRVYDFKAALVAGRQRLSATNGGPSASACVDFESLILDTRYVVGSLFRDSGATILGKTFYWGSGTPYDGGFAQVQNNGMAGGSGKELAVNNINLAFDYGGSIPGLSLRFGEYGGNLNIDINGDFRNFGNFADIDGQTIGGVKVTVASVPGSPLGVLTLTGTIHSFAIGGQELWIDDVCPLGEDGLGFYVDDASDKLVVAIGWQMDTKGVGHSQLLDPDGNPVPAALRRISPTGTNEVWEVPAPKEGFWRVIVDPDTLKQEYFVSASARTLYEMYLFIGTPIPNLTQGAQVPLLVTFVGRGKPLLGANVVATVKAPNGSHHAVRLMDDGNHGDGEANDGVYGNTYNVTHMADEIAIKPTEGEEPDVVGSYLVNVVGTKGDLRREAQGSFAIQTGEDADQDRIPDDWEREHGLNPENPNDSGTDLDRDKLNAWCEFQLGTDPRNSDTDDGGENDGSETGGKCVVTTQDPLDPDDDRVGPLSSVVAFPEAPRGLPRIRVVLGSPLWGQLFSTDILRQVYAPGGQLIQDWQMVGSTTLSSFFDAQVQAGQGYAYMAVPTIGFGPTPLAATQETSATGRILVSNIAYASTDPYPPSGSILINHGDFKTEMLTVTLELAVDDTVAGHDGSPEEPVPGSPPEEIMMRLSNSPDFTSAPWQPFQPEVTNWQLGSVLPGSMATVYVQFKDAQDNVSETGLGQMDSIFYQPVAVYLPLLLR